MKRFLALCAVLFVIGCGATRPSTYVFFPTLPHAEEWTRTYPARVDSGTPRFTVTNVVNKERVDFFSDPSLYRDPMSVAGEIKIHFVESGYGTSDIMASSDGAFACFRIRYKHGESGEVVVFRASGVRGCVVAVGRWPASNDAQALADMNAIMTTIVVQEVE